MIDTVALRLLGSGIDGAALVETASSCLDEVSEHSFSDGGYALVGYVNGQHGNGLKATISPRQIKVGGSLCKWYLGDNYQTMTRRDVQHAVEALSDTLHLPLWQATVTRLDVGCNIPTQHPCTVYYNHFGTLPHTRRLTQPDGILYKGASECMCIYDKNKEQRVKRETIPALYKDRNVLRVEARCMQRLSQCFHREVTAATLYDESFYIQALTWMYTSYQHIQKVNDITLNFHEMKTTKQLYRMGVVALLERVGGEGTMLAHLKEAQSRGDLTAKQAHDLRAVIKNVCGSTSPLTVKSDAAREVDKKMKETMRYYR